MAENNEEVWLQTEQSDGSFRCESFSGVPVARPSWIALASAGSTAGRQLAGQLHEELEAVLLGSSPEVKQTPISCPALPWEMRPESFLNRQKLLVLIGSNDAKFRDLPWFSHWESETQDAAVMTVLPLGDFNSFFVPEIANQDEHLLRRVNANRWEKAITEAAPGVLARAEVTVSAARLFISYRRLETLPIALQLFDRLTHEGFEVFIDRFSIPPGYDFQRRLRQELEDKSMVLLLESKGAKDSKWTQHEIDFVKRHRLGLLALRMPDVEPKEALASVSFDAVFRPLQRDRDFIGEPRQVMDEHGNSVDEWPELKSEALEELVAAVKRAHAQALFRRRHRLRSDLVVELKKRGIQTEYSAAGPLFAKFGEDEHLLWPITRPPEVEDFRTTHQAHRLRTGISAKSHGVVIGPRAAQESDRLARLKWLEEVSGCPSFDEGKLADFADRLVAGKLVAGNLI
jgi:hypothetical protein